MTREEIMQLNTDYLNGCESEHKMNELFSYVLEQQPCDDAISRILARMWNCRGKHTISIDKVKMEQIIRDELPPVIPQQKYGKWIFHEIEDTLRWYECDQCGAEAVREYNYCPNCGAKMQESEDKTE